MAFQKETSSPSERESATFQNWFERAVNRRNVFVQMENSPHISSEELAAAIGLSHLENTQPEIRTLHSTILADRDRVDRALKESMLMAQKQRVPQAVLLFQGLAENNHNAMMEPEGKIELERLACPFAVVMQVDEVDFQKMRSPDSNGYFVHNERYSWAAKSTETFPVVVLLRNGRATTRYHEIGHAWNHAMDQAFKAIDNDCWGGIAVAKPSLEKLKRDVGEVTQEGQYLDGLLSPGQTADFIDFLWGLAKDEFLAEVYEGYPSHKAKNILNEKGSYNYVRTFISMLEMHTPPIKTSEYLYQYLWAHYFNIAKPNLEIAARAHQAYKSLGISSRAQMLPWMLAETPLTDWAGSLEQSGITTEALHLERIAGLIELYFRQTYPAVTKATAWSTSQQDNRVGAVLRKHRESLSKIKGEPLLPLIRTLETELLPYITNLKAPKT